ncbi:epoxide hydrolase family protein [Oryzicola mucosus]|uniref:Epoxide hydrolase n=1 Tax=Oryzicola mucosus TaxID=2767425 RepID=A0A8J6PVI9_9HYPH|nr:epoxide hydrolase family protein [Oryzicola mucosus]MBD0416744.1 epoxide hydrolase [Oryzicola mucosus]
MTALIQPFWSSVPQTDIDDLHRRLAETRWPPAGPQDGWAGGADQAYIRRIVCLWGQFDWPAFEKRLNARPNFVTEIDGQQIHFLWVRSPRPNAVPLILTHGWPSSFLEYLPIVDRLTDPVGNGPEDGPAFDVVVPSLPGFGFSAAPQWPGMSPRRIAGLWVKLMQRLGYDRFAAFGCDWGAYVTALMGLDHPDRISAIQMGYLSLMSPDARPNASDLEEKAYGERRRRWNDEEFGYFYQQGTKPATVGIPLNDSPAGLAAWIIEKWRAWADCIDDPAEIIAMDSILATLSLYWFTQTASSSARIYYESRRDPVRLAPGQRVEVPSGFFLEAPRSSSPGKTERTGPPPRRLAELAFNVQGWFVAPKGGHFPGLETPDLLTREIRSFFAAQHRPHA